MLYFNIMNQRRQIGWDKLPPSRTHFAGGRRKRGISRRELCEALLSANREFGERARLRDAADEMLKDWKAQESQITALEKLGFTVTQGRKHYKLRRDKTGYFVTLPASPSDHRGGANAVSDFNGKFF